jgi:hypothetical protein
MLEWLRLGDALVGILSLGFYFPRWWGRAFDYYLDRGWI